jgi:replicative superfamily II helicase
LQLGIAIHHWALPVAFRKEVERLLHQGVLRLTVSSPTLAQGHNLSATCIIFHGLIRTGTRSPLIVNCNAPPDMGGTRSLVA